MTMQKPVRRYTLVLGVMLVSLLSLTLVIDQEAEQTHRSSFQRALVTFALARTLNGVISTIQGTELALQPAGLGLTLTPGEILDPVNDLVERFSWVMLAATVSLGVQDVLMDISGWLPLRILVCVIAFALLLAVAWPGPRRRRLIHFLGRLLLLSLFLRFAIPATLLANEMAFAVFLEDRYADSARIVDETGADLEQLGSEETEQERALGASESGFFGGVGRAVGSAAEALNVRARVEAIKQKANAVIEHVINLSVVFVLQTVIFPILFLWAMVRLWGWMFRAKMTALDDP